MADKTTETRNTNFDGKTNCEFTSQENAAACSSSSSNDDIAVFDEEIKSIFDNLRLIGNPHDYSLDEALVKAIGAEKELLRRNKVKTSGEKNSRGIFGKSVKFDIKQIFKISESDLQFQVMSILPLILASVCILFVLPLTGQEKELQVTEQFRKIQVQVRAVL